MTYIQILFLPNFPDWAVPCTKISSIYNLDSAYNLNTIDFASALSNYEWSKVPGGYQLKLVFIATALAEGEPITVNFNLELIIVNERNYLSFQTQGT